MSRRPVVDPRFPVRLRQLRDQRGLSLRALARRVYFGKSYLSDLEHGTASPSLDAARRLDATLGAGGELAALVHPAPPLPGPATPASNRASAATADTMVEHLRRTLMIRRHSGDPALAGRDLTAIHGDARAAHDVYQRSDYLAAAQLLPGTIAAAEEQVRQLAGQTQREAHRALAVANVAASKLTAKLGDGTLAWMTADRAASSALLAEDRALSGIAAYQIGCALMCLPDRLGDAQDVVSGAAADLAPGQQQATPVELSVRGALLLLGALVAARTADRSLSKDLLAEAEHLAARLGHDRNDLWSGFGPTNVLIHQLSAAVELHRPDDAISLGERLDTSGLPPALVGRRAQVHLDLAAAFVLKDELAPAVLHLLEAERLAPQLIRVNYAARSLVQDLLRRERRVVTPGLRPLADRAGVLV